MLKSYTEIWGLLLHTNYSQQGLGHLVRFVVVVVVVVTHVKHSSLCLEVCWCAKICNV